MKPYLLLLSAIALFAACGKEEGGEDNNNNNTNNNNNNLCEGGSCIDSFVGNYHWVGDSIYFHCGYPDVIVSIDDTASIIRVGDFILSCHGDNLVYVDSIEEEYVFAKSLGLGSKATLSFKKPFKDTAYYHYNFRIGECGIRTKSLTGVKIH